MADDPLEQALVALRERRLDDARRLLRSALPAGIASDPAIMESALVPRFEGTFWEWGVLTLGALAIIAGGWVVLEHRGAPYARQKEVMHHG